MKSALNMSRLSPGYMVTMATTRKLHLIWKKYDLLDICQTIYPMMPIYYFSFGLLNGDLTFWVRGQGHWQKGQGHWQKCAQNVYNRPSKRYFTHQIMMKSVK